MKNRKYIKRQLVLMDLGIPIDNKIKDLYDYFNKLINVNNLKKLNHDNYPCSTFWSEKNVIIMEYMSDINIFFLRYEPFWYLIKRNNDTQFNTKEIITCFIERKFNLTFKRAAASYFMNERWEKSGFKIVDYE